jgi:hypothetical protein
MCSRNLVENEIRESRNSVFLVSGLSFIDFLAGFCRNISRLKADGSTWITAIDRFKGEVPMV